MTPRPLIRLSLLLAASFALAACSQEAPTPAAGAAQAPASNASASAPPANRPGTPAAAPAQTPSAPERTPGPVVPPTGPAPVAGTDYVEIPGGQPFQPGTGKIEVVEVFGYTCPHCATFEPMVSAWAAKLPADVNFVPVAAPFGGMWMPYAKAFYTAQAMGLLDQTHDAMFRAIHIDRSLPVQPPPSDEQLAQFYAQYGADPQQFTSTMNSFAIGAKLNRAQQFLQRSGVNSTPTLVVAGKYRVTPGSHEEALRIAEHLIARERAARGGAQPAAGDQDDGEQSGQGDADGQA
jgi:thiol:disulfide interchange protein DsbA